MTHVRVSEIRQFTGSCKEVCRRLSPNHYKNNAAEHDFTYGTTMTEANMQQTLYLQSTPYISPAMGCPFVRMWAKIDHVITAPQCIVHSPSMAKSDNEVTKYTSYPTQTGNPWGGFLRMWGKIHRVHYDDVIMDAIASQITSLTIVYSTVYSDADQRKHQSSASMAFVHSPHKWPVTRKMLPFDDVIML